MLTTEFAILLLETLLLVHLHCLHIVLVICKADTQQHMTQHSMCKGRNVAQTLDLLWQADPSRATMPVHAFGQHDPSVATQWFYGSLPREAVCTENLTPWLKLLPCQGRQGLTQLMDRPTLYGASFHSMQVNLVVHSQPQPSCPADAADVDSCPVSHSSQGNMNSASIEHSTVTTATLTQTLTLVLRPEQMHTPDTPKSTFSNQGKVIHPQLDLQRLFNVPGVAACSKATHTHMYFQIPRSLIAKADAPHNASDLHAIQNTLYTTAPPPDTVISSSSAVFLFYNVTASTRLAGLQDTQHQQCMQPSITWHGQPDDWQAQVPAAQVCPSTAAQQA